SRRCRPGKAPAGLRRVRPVPGTRRSRWFPAGNCARDPPPHRPGRDLHVRVSGAWPPDTPRQRKEATMSANADPAAPPRLELYGGRWTALIPALVLIAVMCILSFAERAAVPAFWVGGFAALVVGLALARNRTAF